jgi:hypothetical protein
LGYNPKAKKTTGNDTCPQNSVAQDRNTTAAKAATQAATVIRQVGEYPEDRELLFMAVSLLGVFYRTIIKFFVLFYQNRQKFAKPLL